MTDTMTVPAFEKGDYIKSTKPYEWLMKYKEDPFLYAQAVELVKIQAGSVGVRNFMSLLKAYRTSTKIAADVVIDNATAFTNQPLELLLPPDWEADDGGISTTVSGKGTLYACNHPIMPVQRLVNIDSETEKIKLGFCRRGGVWRYIIVDKKTIASRQSIVGLSEFGVAVNSENAGLLVRYLTDAESYNIDRLEEINSVGRLGWIENHGFSPYVERLVFDGDLSFKQFFESVRQQGDYDTWKLTAGRARENSIITRIILAASFASVLVAPCDALSFFVHTWGGTEAGKTVGLMLAASVWANPEQGAYWHTFNSTAVGQELSAGFVNSMPLIIDELQIIGERRDFDKMIYTLSEGVGRSRGNKSGGLQRVSSWRNCIITTGEIPITSASSAGGAVNRIVEIDCKEQKLFKEPQETVSIIKRNYGYAGKEFIERLKEPENMRLAVEKQKECYKLLCAGESTEKQAMAASLILTADYLISRWIFGDDTFMVPMDIEPYLVSKSDVSANERAYDYLIDYVNIHHINFETNVNMEFIGETWGLFDYNKNTGRREVFIIKSMFDQIMTRENYNPTAFLSWAKETGHIRVATSSMQKGNKRSTIQKRFSTSVINTCVCLVLPDLTEDAEQEYEQDDICF